MKNKIFVTSLWTFLLIFLDQITKYLVHTYLQNSVNLLGSFFRIEYSQNTGVAFGIHVPYIVLIIATVLLVSIVVAVAHKEFKLDDPIAKTGLILIVSGAISNLIDRVSRGFVIDFIAVWHWPNFNLADTYISIGILLMIVFYGRIKRTQNKK